MAEYYRFFNSTADDTREYTAADFAEYFSSIISDGVLLPDEGGLKVGAASSGLAVTVQPGRAWLQGYFYLLDAAQTLALADANASKSRTDAIALRLNLATDVRSISLAVITDVLGGTLPSVTRAGDVYEIILAYVTVGAGATSITADNITDARHDDTVCGGAAVLSAKVTAGTLGGLVQANSAAIQALTAKQVRNIIIATSAPATAVNGDIWLSYS